MWTSRTFLAHSKDHADADIDRWVACVREQLLVARPGWDCIVTAGRDDYERRAVEVGGWEAWTETVVGGTDYDGNPLFDEMVVPIALPTISGLRVLVGKATAGMVAGFVQLGKPVYVWSDDPAWTLGFADMTGMQEGRRDARGARDWRVWAWIEFDQGSAIIEDNMAKATEIAPARAATRRLMMLTPEARARAAEEKARKEAQEKMAALQAQRAAGREATRARLASMTDWADFVDDARDLISLCEELQERKPQGDDFFSSVIEKVSSMADWAEERQTATERMATALAGMRQGVERWVR